MSENIGKFVRARQLFVIGIDMENQKSNALILFGAWSSFEGTYNNKSFSLKTIVKS